ncbi:conserved Plasmodium protein, unknown function [Plasmodium berghei]|uniref:Uncharacterized protein n=2 Tax=Plasmodium berghei TaxID=5821 RepID=A0A509AMK8_PLABA|nr:conserved Plasmodium protein, unknown function [Plasmodium berghei ANKA]CXI45909.1 conserved Plasmodium protein, unknown function [Plasmodium berghei]SCM22728.1 conserved Plasmodium protein, unknown function [Plasmodium berghei]SCN25635.1 conserved Plasmodium protein, unknown function [Plasmodium berghei]SCO60570.1 conserved Plasmodium protein, unknown function [Plasmodium berghei]SCO62317.1 conserved Plasmodium protein, unknown function [Plasmodium berghei]|eukprot:XP_034421734.1 conserved Plasmodium protein, unknown function [Plasmodium berghei ANKA]
MGNTNSQNDHNNKSLMLLNDNHSHIFPKACETNYTKNVIDTQIGTFNGIDNIKKINIIENTENEYNKLRKKVIDDLIKENEMYINNQKETLYKFEDPNLKVTQTNNECFYDENKIYKCLKNMNQSTSNFVNLYSRCCRYLRNYESCVQKIKI